MLPACALGLELERGRDAPEERTPPPRIIEESCALLMASLHALLEALHVPIEAARGDGVDAAVDELWSAASTMFIKCASLEITAATGGVLDFHADIAPRLLLIEHSFTTVQRRLAAIEPVLTPDGRRSIELAMTVLRAAIEPVLAVVPQPSRDELTNRTRERRVPSPFAVLA